VLNWTNMRVPDGEDYVEFMLYGDLPAPNARGSAHHICLEVKDIDGAKARLVERPYAKDYGRPLEIRTGVNRKRQLNLYDPDGTRVELMEPFTVDGQPAPRSDGSATATGRAKVDFPEPRGTRSREPEPGGSRLRRDPDEILRGQLRPGTALSRAAGAFSSA
jgi:hypothetical protein